MDIRLLIKNISEREKLALAVGKVRVNAKTILKYMKGRIKYAKNEELCYDHIDFKEETLQKMPCCVQRKQYGYRRINIKTRN